MSAPFRSTSVLDELQPGDEYIVEWHDRTRERYRVDEIRDGWIIYHRWVATKETWTPWRGMQNRDDMRRFKVSVAK